MVHICLADLYMAILQLPVDLKNHHLKLVQFSTQFFMRVTH